MLVSDILHYWYSVEVPRSPERLQRLILITADAFSIPFLIRTLFAPWRQDVVPTYGLALQERLRAFWYNLVAILVGFTVRLFVLLTGSIAVGLIVFLGSVFLLVYLLLPVVPVLLFLSGMVILFRS